MIGMNHHPPKINRIAPYAPLPWQFAALRDKSKIMLLSGSGGGGKSRCASEKVHAYLMKYPGAKGLMMRKTQDAANKSCVPLMWETVMGGLKSGVNHNQSEHTFKYPNGSTLYTGGMKNEEQREAIRSIGSKGGLDIIWVEEANKIDLEDYQELLVRLRGTAASWRQIILTTNPDAPNHWINKRLILSREASTYYSGAKDNPYNPPDYIALLNTLTGTQKLRLVDGLWVQGEGVIYDQFSVQTGGNVSEVAEYNPDWEVAWGVDDGYAHGMGRGTESYHPRVFLLGQYTPQGGVNIFAEYYKTLEVEEKSLKAVLEYSYPRPYIAYVDSSAAQLKARIWDEGIQTIGATHPVTEGIRNVRRLVCDGNDVRLLTIHPRCTELIGEMQSYAKVKSDASNHGEPVPAKIDDHGPSVLRYMTWHLRFKAAQ